MHICKEWSTAFLQYEPLFYITLLQLLLFVLPQYPWNTALCCRSAAEGAAASCHSNRDSFPSPGFLCLSICSVQAIAYWDNVFQMDKRFVTCNSWSNMCSCVLSDVHPEMVPMGLWRWGWARQLRKEWEFMASRLVLFIHQEILPWWKKMNLVTGFGHPEIQNQEQ